MNRAARLIVRTLSCAVVSLAIVGWVRSYWSIDAVHWSDGQHFISVLSSAGRVNVHMSKWLGKTAWGSGFTFASTSRVDPADRPLWETDPGIYGRRRFLGFEWSTNLSPWPSNQTIFQSFHLPTYTLIGVPYWAIMLLGTLPWAMPHVRGYRRRSRQRQGLCPACAYDLRATPAGCPECGWRTPVLPATASAAAPIVPM